MDASDILRNLQNRTIYTYYQTTVLSKQSTCNYSTCSTVVGAASNTGCRMPTYVSYELRQQVVNGQLLANSCSSIGCGCAS